MTTKQMEKKIAELERRLAKLEEQKRKSLKVRKQARTVRRTRRASKPLQSGASNSQIVRALQGEGVLAKPTEQELAAVASWQAQPQTTRAKLVDEFRMAAPSHQLSDIVIENRR